MKKCYLVFVALLSVLLLNGCNKNENSKKGATIIGDWNNSGFVYTFNEDKTCQYDAVGTIMKCTYTIDGDKLSILFEGDDLPFDTTYRIEDNKLIIKDSFDEDTVYTRK